MKRRSKKEKAGTAWRAQPGDGGLYTLEELHHTIFNAFDREDEHMYEFQIGGKGPMDPKARKYVLPMERGDPFGDEKPAGRDTHDHRVAGIEG